MSSQLYQARLGDLHESVDFAFAAREVVDCKCVDGDSVETAKVETDLENGFERCKAGKMTLLNGVVGGAGPASVAVHYESYVTGDGAEREGMEQKLLGRRYREERE